MIYIKTDIAGAITEIIDSDRSPIPAGGIELSDIDADRIAKNPIGHGAFKYQAGTLNEDAAIMAVYTLKVSRADKIREVSAYALDLIGETIPALADENQMGLLVALFQAGAFRPGFPAAGSDMERVKDVYLYARTKINQARTATQAQLDAYDPTTDPNWP